MVPIGTLSLGSLKVAISERVGVGSAVVSGIWIRHATGRSDRSGVRDRTGRGGADGASSFVGDRACRWHRNGIVNIAAAAGGEPGRSATLGGGIGDTGEGAREAIANDRTADFARPDVRYHNSVGVL